VWDVATGRKVADVTVPRDGSPVGASLSPDGSLVAGAWPNANRVRVFPTAGGEPWVIHAEGVTSTEFRPDGRRIAVASMGTGIVRIVDVSSRREVLTLEGPEDIWKVAWSPDGSRIAVARPDGAAVHDARTGSLQLVTFGHTGNVKAVAWSPDSAQLATGSDDGTARVWALDRRTARETIRLSAQDLRNGVSAVAFSPDGEQLMTSDFAITAVKVWDVRDTGAPEVANVPALEGEARCGTALAPDGESVWTAEGSRGLRRHDIATGRPLQSASTPGWCLWPSADRRLMAAIDGDLPFPVLDTRTGEVAYVVRGGVDGYATEVAWDGTGDHLAVVVTRPAVDDDGTEGDRWESMLLVYDRTGREVGRVSGEPGIEMTTVSFRGDGDVIATTGFGARPEPQNSDVRLWDWRDNRLLARIDGKSDRVRFAPTGDLLVSSRYIQGVADVWDTGTGHRVASLEGHTGFITNLAFDRAGNRVATTSLDGSVRIWDPRTGRQQLALRLATPQAAWSAEFSPDGDRLVTTWADGVTRVWTLDVEELVKIARQRVTRGLTTAECQQYLHTATCPAG
jgi:WD40 repeat protein